jgi:hypothetical protein
VDQGDVNEAFQQMAAAQVFQDMEALINAFVRLESESRHHIACAGDPQAAALAADEAYRLLMDSPMKVIPTLILGLADRFNREHEILMAVLERVEDAKGHLELSRDFRGRQMSEMERVNVDCALNFLAEITGSVPYMIDGEDNADNSEL